MRVCVHVCRWVSTHTCASARRTEYLRVVVNQGMRCAIQLREQHVSGGWELREQGRADVRQKTREEADALRCHCDVLGTCDGDDGGGGGGGGRLEDVRGCSSDLRNGRDSDSDSDNDTVAWTH